uniref:Uncharacterized protein n=1 Tax=Anguilla anguilla TaxID=7936 RepID=A0A0E9WX85_ANGAN
MKHFSIFIQKLTWEFLKEESLLKQYTVYTQIVHHNLLYGQQMTF